MTAPEAHRHRASTRGGLAALLLAALPAVAASTPPASPVNKPAPAQQPLRCEPPVLGRDRLTVVCALDAAAPQRIHIRVRFTGSHDDTTASMDIAIDDVTVACDTGSKTSTESEDGDVTLDCRFTAPGKTSGPTVLRASAKWFHAQYVHLEVDNGPP
jgi:hypothetical protein